MMAKIILSESDRETLENIIKRGKSSARKVARAHIVLKSAEGWSIAQIAQTFGVSAATVSNIRARYWTSGVSGVLEDRVQQKRRQALSGAAQAFIVATACSQVPDGHDHWTVRMLHERVIEMGFVETVSPATIHAVLKKTPCNPGKPSRGASRKAST